jgi:hypothetical protein
MASADRYWSVMLIDAYTNVRYVSRRLYGSAGVVVRVTYDPDAPPVDDRAADVIAVGTPTVWVLVRVLVDGADDLDDARIAQRSIEVQPASAPPSAAAGRPARSGRDVDASSGPPHRVHAAGAAFFDELAAALRIDPPGSRHPAMGPEVAALLADPPAADLLAEGVRLGEERIRAHGLGVDRRANGWGTRSRGAAFGDDVTYRAAFAKYSLAGHLPAENRSYARGVDGSTPVALRFAPGAEPPTDAFWSLTMYGPDMFFVPNDIDRYSIGDRTAGLERDRDGGLTVIVSHERPERAANWLPAAAGGCVLALRVYEGSAAVVGATWFPPDVQSITRWRSTRR